MLSEPTKGEALRESAWESTKGAFRAISESRFGDAVDCASRVGARILGVTFNLAAIRVGKIIGVDPRTIKGIVGTIRNKELTASQKVLPVLGLSLTLVFTIPVAALLLVGATAMVPPLTFAASIAGLIRDTTEYIKHYTERSNIRNKLISQVDVSKKIDKDKKLSKEQKATLKESLSGERDVLNALYQLRQDVISNGSLSLDKKTKLVNQLNAKIEDFTESKPISLDQIARNLETYQLPELKSKAEGFQALIDTHQRLKTTIADYPIASSLKKDLDRFNSRQRALYSQDLPASLKDSIEKMLSGKKIQKDDLKLMYARIGNHYLNTTIPSQIKAQDLTFDKKVAKSVHDEPSRQQIRDSIQRPREILASLQKLNEQSPSPEISTFIDKFVANPFSIESLTDYLNETNIPQKVKLRTQLQDLNTLHNTAIASVANSKLAQKLDQHILQTLSQQALAPNIEFRSPTIRLELPKVEPTTPEKSYANSFKGRMIRRLFGEKSLDRRARNNEISTEQAAKAQILQDQFAERNKTVFGLIENKERLNFLEKAVPRHALNIALHTTTAVLSLGATFLLPLIFTPAAPGAAAAATLLGGLTSVLTVTSIANLVGLTVKEQSSEKKMATTKTKVTEAVVPDLQVDKKSADKMKRWQGTPFGAPNLPPTIAQEQPKPQNLAPKPSPSPDLELPPEPSPAKSKASRKPK